MKKRVISLALGLMISPVLADIKTDIVNNYSRLADAHYSDSLTGAKKLQLAIQEFTAMAENADTSLEVLESKFENVKSVWANEARIPYGQSEIFRFYNGPIDFENVDDGIETHLEKIEFVGVEGLLNAWPLDEGYIDYINGSENSGLINDRSVELNRSTISAMNERDGEKNISTGYHAIEFLLWGQDESLDSAGKRPVTDFVDGGTSSNQDRRRQYLNLLVDTLVDHLSTVQEQWKPNTDNYRNEFVSLKRDEALTNMFTSMILMTGDELKSERIEVAFLIEDQEDEQSCFSDMTINDIYANARGVYNIYYGDYKFQNSVEFINGVGINELVSNTAPELDALIGLEFKELFNAIGFFYENGSIGEIAIPFDRAITHNRDELQRVIDSLDKLDGYLKETAKALYLEVEL